MRERPRKLAELREAAPPSRAQRKRELEKLRQLGITLAKLPQGKFDKLELPEDLHDALVEVRRLKDKNAIRRQFMRIQAIIDNTDDLAAILESLETIDGK